MRIQWSRGADTDLDYHVHYIAQENIDAALRVQERILARIAGLAEHPEAGRIGRVPGTRELPITGTPYVAIYELIEKTVVVLRLMHGAQQWPPATLG